MDGEKRAKHHRRVRLHPRQASQYHLEGPLEAGESLRDSKVEFPRRSSGRQRSFRRILRGSFAAYCGPSRVQLRHRFGAGQQLRGAQFVDESVERTRQGIDRRQRGHRIRRHDHQLRPRRRHRLHQAVHELGHLHSVQDPERKAHAAVFLHESVGRGNLALRFGRVRLGQLHLIRHGQIFALRME